MKEQNAILMAAIKQAAEQETNIAYKPLPAPIDLAKQQEKKQASKEEKKP
jgi:hypothetical protein